MSKNQQQQKKKKKKKKKENIFWTTWGISMKFFRKNVAYDNIRSHKKQGFFRNFRRYISSLFRRYIFLEDKFFIFTLTPQPF